MGHGYKGQILHIDLTNSVVCKEQPEKDFYRKYVGGRSLGLYYMLNEMQPGVNPLSPANILVYATSPTVGVPFPGNARHSVVAKSPLTLGFGESEAGGFWGPELKKAGYDAIVVRGKAPHPVYLYIEDTEVHIRNACGIWGETTGNTIKILQERYGTVQVLCIGPAGEHLVRYAAIAAGHHNVNGRMGLGAVMGSKNMKAIAVKGSEPIEVSDSTSIKSLSRWFAEHFKDDAVTQLLHEVGTAGGVEVYNELGSLPSFNFKYGTIDDAAELSGFTWKRDGLMVGKRTCFACPVACRKVARFRSPFEKGNPWVSAHSAEYESVAALGSNCGITGSNEVLALAALCDDLGMDTISTGVTVAFLMECNERGLLKGSEWGEISELHLSFGNASAAYRLIKKIAYRDGVGDLAAEGVKRLAEKIGPTAKDFAMHVKGEELAVQEPRGQKIGAALGYAVAPQGGDHIQMEHDFQFSVVGPFLESMEPFGIVEPVPSMSLGPAKLRLFTLNQMLWSLYNVFDICIFVGPPGHTYRLEHLLEIIRAVTGWNTNWVELLDIGKRALTMARCFNMREGFSSVDDWLPKRFFEPLKSGNSAGNAVLESELRKAVQMYYVIMGWNPMDGVPTEAMLCYLDLSWVLTGRAPVGVDRVET